MKMPNLASSNHLGSGRSASDSSVGRQLFTARRQLLPRKCQRKSSENQLFLAPPQRRSGQVDELTLVLQQEAARLRRPRIGVVLHVREAVPPQLRHPVEPLR